MFRAVPTTSTFFGITIRRYYNDHPPVHFPARFQGLAGKSTFDGEMINGRISFPIAWRLVRQWAILHRAELEANWRRIERGQRVERIAPLG